MNPSRRRIIAACALILTALMLSASFSAFISTKPPLAEDQPQNATVSAYTAHAPIYINGNAGFLAPNASTGISWGSGTASDPYLIEGWDINASSSHGIYIGNSNVHFIIRDCYIHDGSNNIKYVDIILGQPIIYHGIFLYNCDNGVLERNTCSNNWDGIRLFYYSDGNTLSNNTCSDNYVGIQIVRANSNTLSNNVLVDNGLFMYGTSLSEWNSHNIDTSNTVNGKPVRYYADQSGITVPAGAGQVILANCNGFVIEDQDLSGGSCGVELAYCSDVTVRNNNCSSNNYHGIFLFSSSSNTLSNNDCSSNRYDGIVFYYSSGNTLSNNDCSSNGDYGIYLYVSNSNRLTWNQLRDNVKYGVYVISGSWNEIWNNTFIGNNGAGSTFNFAHIQAYGDGINNRWNSSGTPHGYGNYWGDWTTPDSVAPLGIVDIPYSISGRAGQMDSYPLVAPPVKPTPNAVIVARIDFDPDTLNINSKGRWVTVFIELDAPYDVNCVNVSSLLLLGKVSASAYPAKVGDEDADGIPDLKIKFDRNETISALNVTSAGKFNLTITVSGSLFDGTSFKGTDIIRVIKLNEKTTSEYDSCFEGSILFFLRHSPRGESKHPPRVGGVLPTLHK
jgi:parallel beta-helix repeat protein